MAKKKRSKSPAGGRVKKNGSGPLKEVKEIYEFMKANSLQTVELDKKDFHIRLVRKGSAGIPVPVPVAMTGVVAAPAAGAVAPAAAAPTLPPNAHAVKSPMMGIFYRAASPSSPPFKKEGDTVKPGDVLCMIEAMKVFNDVKAEVGGVVRKVCVENGKSVKVGQDLLIIEKK